MTYPTVFNAIVGSRPNAHLPRLRPQNIYSANSACEIARSYAQSFTKPPPVIAVVGAKEAFEPDLIERIRHSQPDRVVVRGGNTSDAKPFAKKWEIDEAAITVLLRKGHALQALYFGEKTIRKSHTHSFVNYIDPASIVTTVKAVCSSRYSTQGLSTGLFSALLSLHEFPDSPVVLCGIGAGVGTRGHSYTARRPISRRRIAADRYLIKRWPKSMRSSIWSSDYDVSKALNLMHYLDFISEQSPANLELS